MVVRLAEHCSGTRQVREGLVGETDRETVRTRPRRRTSAHSQAGLRVPVFCSVIWRQFLLLRNTLYLEESEVDVGAARRPEDKSEQG